MTSNDKNPNISDIIVVPGQGIGPECTSVAKSVIEATNAPVRFIEGPDIQLGYPDASELLDFLGYTRDEANTRLQSMLQQHGYKDYYKALIASLSSTEKEKLDMEVTRKERITLEKASAAAAVLKGALRTMDVGDEPSRNVTLRKMFEEYANFRRCVSLDPVIPAIHNGVDILFVRENVEDLYAQIEQRLTRSYAQAQRHLSMEGCEKIIVAAFEAALKEGRTKVTGLEKPNILKITGGMFKQAFLEIATRYKPLGIEADFHIIDDGLAKIAASPHSFDVVVTTNMFGDIGSDVAAQITGGVGFVSSNNIGKISMFETMGGTADDIAVGSQKAPNGNLANPVALIDAAAEMLIHIGGPANLLAGEMIKAAILTVLQNGYYTADIKPGTYQQTKAGEAGVPVEKMRLGTREFGAQVIAEITKLQQLHKANPGTEVRDLMPAGSLRDKMRSYKAASTMEKPGTPEWNARLARNLPPHTIRSTTKIQGIDIFIEDTGMLLEFDSNGSIDEAKSQIRHNLVKLFLEKTGVNIPHILNPGKFSNLQEIRSFAEYMASALAQYSTSQEGKTSMQQPFQQLLKEVKLSERIGEHFSPELLKETAASALQKLQSLASQGRTLVKCMYILIAQAVEPLAKRHGFKLLRITNRGTEIYPTMGDLEIRDIHRLRMGVDPAGTLEKQPEQEIKIAATLLQIDILQKGWTIAQILLNRDFYNGEGAQQGKLLKGMSKPYGAGLGEKYS